MKIFRSLSRNTLIRKLRATINSPYYFVTLLSGWFIIFYMYWNNRQYGDEFWLNFSADFLATVIGIIISVYVALELSVYQEKKTEKERKKKILDVLLTEIKENIVCLEIWKQDDFDFTKADSIAKGIIPLHVSLYTESWEAFSSGGELQWVNDPVLLNILAVCYNRVSAIKYISNKYFDLVFSGNMRASATFDYIVKTLRQKVNDALLNLTATEQYIEEVTKKG